MTPLYNWNFRDRQCQVAFDYTCLQLLHQI